MKKTYEETSIRINQKNKVQIKGTVMTNLEYSHKVFGESFYLVYVKVNRLSNSYDEIPIMISDRILDVTEDLTGQEIYVEGEYRSHNLHQDESNFNLKLFVFAKDVYVLESSDENSKNVIFLDGYVCSKPIYRKTPLRREISDIMLAVNRAFGKSDYIPCVAWGRNARYAQNFDIGTNVRLIGRVQSRKYKKRISDDHFEERVAYEVSINKIEVVG